MLSGTSCPFCSRLFSSKANGSYFECITCDVLVSGEAPAPYDQEYYYLKRNVRSKEAKARANLLWRHFGRYISQGKCLDLGCNDGSFVALATEKGADCEGTDLSEAALNIARACGGGVFRSSSELGDTRFECITAFDVVEHIDLLHEFFEFVNHRLARNGVLIITTPNKNSKWHWIFRSGWHGLGIPQYHRFVYSKQFLGVEMERNEFAVEELFTISPLAKNGWKLLVASGYRLRRNRFYKMGALPMALAAFAAGKVLIGGEEDTICIVARKKTAVDG